jgi:adenosylhomocysteine nucleosidase
MLLTLAGRDAGAEMRPSHFALMAALPWEVRPFLRQSKARPRRVRDLPVWDFVLGEGRGEVVLSGMGPAATRRAVASLLARGRPQILVSLGFGGALTPELRPGALVVGESFWHYDPDTQVLAPAAAPASPLPLPEMVHHLREAGLPAFPGTMVTTCHFIHKGEGGAALRRLEHPLLDLETSVLAGVAAVEGLPFVSLRAVTDAAGEEIPDFLGGAGNAATAVGPREALRWLAGDPRRLWPLIKLWRRSRVAALTLARALFVLLPLFLDRGAEFEN